MGAVCCVTSGTQADQPKPVDRFEYYEAEVSADDKVKIDDVSKTVIPRFINATAAERCDDLVQAPTESISVVAAASTTVFAAASRSQCASKNDSKSDHDIDRLAALRAKDSEMPDSARSFTNALAMTPRVEPKRIGEGHARGSLSMDEGSPFFKHPLMVAWKLGRIVQAARELKRVEETKPEDLSIFPPSVIEQVRRIGQKFEESQSLLNIKISELAISESNPKLKLEWGLQISQGLVRATYSVERDLDVCKYIGALQEKDLDLGLKENIVDVQRLGIHKPNDAVWRVQTYSKAIGAKGDEIIVESMADVLDEPMGSIWLAAYSPPKSDVSAQVPNGTSSHGTSPYGTEGSTDGVAFSKSMSKANKDKGQMDHSASEDKEQIRDVKTSPTSRSQAMMKKPSLKRIVRKTKKLLSRKFTSKSPNSFNCGEIFNGIHLPAPEKGHNRSQHMFVATKVTPLHPPGKARLNGFRQTCVVEAKVPAAVLSVISVMPTFMIKKLARNYLEGAIKIHAQKASLPEIENRLQYSERAPFYRQLRCHLLGEPPAPIDWTEDVNVWASCNAWDYSSNVRGDEAAGVDPPGKSVNWAPRDDSAPLIQAAS